MFCRFQSCFPKRAFSTSASNSSLGKKLAIGATVGAVALGTVGAISQMSTKEKGPLDTLTPIPGATVIFVLGGPGAGKGTQCSKLVKEFDFVHLSAGDLLRAERQRKGSPYGELINNYIEQGQIVPMEITVALLYNAMKESTSQRFLVDGFPRKMDQALCFEEKVVPCNPEEEMLKRLLKRGETSGRVDDNVESIKKRFQTFRETSYPVVEHYQQLNKVQTVNCVDPVDKVYAKTRVSVIAALGLEKEK